jgi:hypothetical protein
MGLLRKFYWPKVDEQTVETVDQMREDIKKIPWANPKTNIWDDLLKIGYVACVRTQYTPRVRLRRWWYCGNSFEFHHSNRDNIKIAVMKMAYGGSSQQIAKTLVIRKR